MFQELRSNLKAKTRRIFLRQEVDSCSTNSGGKGDELKRIDQNRDNAVIRRSWRNRSMHEPDRSDFKCVSKLGESYQPQYFEKTSFTDDYKARNSSVYCRQSIHELNKLPLSARQFKEMSETKRLRLNSVSFRRGNHSEAVQHPPVNPDQNRLNGSEGAQIKSYNNLPHIDENTANGSTMDTPPGHVERSNPNMKDISLHDSGKQGTNYSNYSCPNCSHVGSTNRSLSDSRNIMHGISTNRSKYDPHLSSNEVITIRFTNTKCSYHSSIDRNHAIRSRPRAVVFHNNTRVSRISQSLKQLLFRSKRRQIEADAKSLNSFSNHSGHSRKSSDTSQISLVSGESSYFIPSTNP